MLGSLWTILAASGVVSSPIAQTRDGTSRHDHVNGEQVTAELVRRSAKGHGALMRGNVKAYRQFVTSSADFLLFSPFGGAPTRGPELTEARFEAMGRFFKNGTFTQEVLQTYSSADMVVLAVIERQNVEVGGLPAQDLALRVTLVYRRQGEDWLLIHRHADPLVNGVSLDHAAVLARGDAPARQS